MTINSALPVLYPSRPKELPIKVFVCNGDIHTVFTTIDSARLCFFKDTNGMFTAEAVADIDISFVSYIAGQLNRVFG